MLFYHGRGRRDYAARPHPLRRRAHWEFACILAGSARPVLADGEELADGPALWIFPPRHGHGWTGTAGRPCTVCIVHLAACPRVVAAAVEAAGRVRVPLGVGERRTLRLLDVRLAALLAERPDAGEVAADLWRGACAELALRVIPASGGGGGGDAERTVKQLLSWLDEHLHHGVGIAEAGRALAVSPAHLRRLCHQVTGRGPRALLQELRLDRARDLLRRGQRPLTAIAWDCGFGSAVALSQAFLRRFGCRPGAWRERG